MPAGMGIVVHPVNAGMRPVVHQAKRKSKQGSAAGPLTLDNPNNDHPPFS